MNSVKGKDTIMWKHFITSSIAFFALAVAANAQSHRTIEAHAHLGNVSTTISASNWHNINQRSYRGYDRHYDRGYDRGYDRHYGPHRDHRYDNRVRHADPRRYHQAPSGYYATRMERVWIPGYWDVTYSRCGDRIRIWVPGRHEMRRVKVWIPCNTRGRR